MARAHGQLDRALSAMTVGMLRGQQERARLGEPQGEYVQQVRLPIKGKAVSGSVATASYMVQFVTPFLYAPGQRNAPFTTPHFHYGVVWNPLKLAYKIPDAPIPRDFAVPPQFFLRVHAHVLKWMISEEGWVTAAFVEIGVEAPNYGVVDDTPPGGVPVTYDDDGEGAKFEGEVHFTFQGYSSYPEADP